MEKYIDDHPPGHSESASTEDESETLLESNLMQASVGKKARIFRVSCLVILLVFSNLVLSAIILLRQQQQNQAKEKPRQSWEPPEKYRTEIFEFQPIYGAEPNAAVDQAWVSMIPSMESFPFAIYRAMYDSR